MYTLHVLHAVLIPGDRKCSTYMNFYTLGLYHSPLETKYVEPKLRNKDLNTSCNTFSLPSSRGLGPGLRSRDETNSHTHTRTISCNAVNNSTFAYTSALTSGTKNSGQIDKLPTDDYITSPAIRGNYWKISGQTDRLLTDDMGLQWLDAALIGVGLNK